MKSMKWINWAENGLLWVVFQLINNNEAKRNEVKWSWRNWMEFLWLASLVDVVGYGRRPSNAKKFHSNENISFPLHSSCSFFSSCSFHSHSQPLKIDLLKKSEIGEGMEGERMELSWASNHNQPPRPHFFLKKWKSGQRAGNHSLHSIPFMKFI